MNKRGSDQRSDIRDNLFDATPARLSVQLPFNLNVRFAPTPTALLQSLLDTVPGLKHKAALSVAYGAGLRATELISLKVCEIDSKRMIIRVERARAARTHPKQQAITRKRISQHARVLRAVRPA